jgi:hypothetical protein
MQRFMLENYRQKGRRADPARDRTEAPSCRGEGPWSKRVEENDFAANHQKIHYTLIGRTQAAVAAHP